MNVLIGCEFSGVVRDAFRKRGHQAYSCDLLASEDNRYHIQADINWVLNYPQRVLGGHPMLGKAWDLLIAHPPCTYLCNSGVRWLFGGKGTTVDPVRWRKMQEACDLFEMLLGRDGRATPAIPKIAIENPIMHKYARERINRPYDQIVHPWMFGQGESKATCLWLKGLPMLVATNVVEGRRPRVHHESPGPDRWKRRSITYQGLADAMAEQWG